MFKQTVTSTYLLVENFQKIIFNSHTLKIVSENDQEIPQPQTADKHVASCGRAAQQSRETRKINKVKQLAQSKESEDFSRLIVRVERKNNI